MKKILFVVLLMLARFSGQAQTISSDSLLAALKTAISRESMYDLNKEKRINLLRFQLMQTSSSDFLTQFNLEAQLFEEYHSFKFDSAFVWARRITALAERFGDRDRLISSEIMLGTALLNTGFYKEAFDITGNIDTTRLSRALKTDYLLLRARLHAGIGDYDNDAFFSRQYYRQSEADFKNAETVTPSNEFEKMINLAFLPDSTRPRQLTPDFFYHYILGHHLTAHGIAMVATRVSFAYTGENRVVFLALAAINDVQASTKETLAIFLLGQELFRMGKTNDAYFFMQEASRNAKFYGARNRSVQIESMLPLVAGKVIAEKQHEKDKLLIGLLVFLIVVVVLFFLLVIYRRQLLRIKANEQVIREKNRELENVNGKLWESSKIKEELIGLFFKTCSAYIETLDKVKHKTQHNIKLGKYSDINTFLNELHIDEEKGQLYAMLDTVFLTMFPNFITAFNALLKKEDQVWPKSGETLNATLRIFALMRLGITENEAIAKILDYSVSTVYTYKMRIRSRAQVPAGDFERKIMEIKFIDNNVVDTGLAVTPAG